MQDTFDKERLPPGLDEFLREANPWWEGRPGRLVLPYRRWAFQTALQKLDSGLERLDAKIDARIDGLDAKIDARINGLDAKIDARINGLDAKIDARTDGLDARIEGLRREMNVQFRWMLGTMVAVGALIVAALKLLP